MASGFPLLLVFAQLSFMLLTSCLHLTVVCQSLRLMIYLKRETLTYLKLHINVLLHGEQCIRQNRLGGSALMEAS